MDFLNNGHIGVRLPGHTSTSGRLSDSQALVRNVRSFSNVGIEDFLAEAKGAGVYAGHGIPITIPDGAEEGDNYVDLDNGDWYQLGADMQWIVIGNIQGPAGTQLSPEDLQAIVDEAEAEVLDSLEPPIDLTILFLNSLA